jgi:hypothetical protein
MPSLDIEAVVVMPAALVGDTVKQN